VIVSVNEAWRRFARENEAPGLAQSSVGTNYLSICRNGDSARADAQAIFDGIEAVLSGKLSAFDREYACHSVRPELSAPI
jgi:hypothetical protein